MSYTAPSLSSLDLSDAVSGYSSPDLGSLDLSGDPPLTDLIDAALEFSAAFEGSAGTVGALGMTVGFSAQFVGGQVAGELAAGLGFAASFDGSQGTAGGLAVSLDFSGAFAGQVVPVYGAAAAGLSFSPRMRGFLDWTATLDPVQITEFYTLDITGDPGRRFRISSWQATLQAGARSNYVQAVIPGNAEVIGALQALQDGELVISKGYRFPDQSERTEEILRAGFDELRFDEGPRNFTATVSGYADSGSTENGVRELTAVRSVSFANGKYRVRAGIDMFLRPGMTVTAGGVSFPVDFINYYVSETDRFCEVSQR